MEEAFMEHVAMRVYSHRRLLVNEETDILTEMSWSILSTTKTSNSSVRISYMISRDYIQSITKARRMLPKTAWQNILNKITSLSSQTDEISIDQVLSGLSNTDAAWLLRKAFEDKGDLTWQQVTAVLATVEVIYGSPKDDLEILWSGPANGLFPVRRFDQVLYDLVQAATRRILLVTFAAAKIDTLCNHLHAALLKGITVTLVLEAEMESEGQLSYDAAKAFRPLV